MRNLLQKIYRAFSRLAYARRVDDHLKINVLGIRANFRYYAKIAWPNITSSGISRIKRNPKIIASFTSIPKRIHSAAKVAAALLAQNFKPDMLVLWLSSEEFAGGESSLPGELLRLRKYGLDIRWCPNFLSYKKLVPSLLEFPDDIIITFDDDIYYAPDVVENLYNSFKKYPDAIHCYRTHRISVGPSNSTPMMPCPIQMSRKFEKPSFLNIIMSGSGTLFPPHSLHPDAVNEKIFMKQLPTQDEAFFWAMAVRNNTRVVNVKNFDFNFTSLKGTQKYALKNINKSGMYTGIDSQSAINLMVETYPELLPKLKSENPDE